MTFTKKDPNAPVVPRVIKPTALQRRKAAMDAAMLATGSAVSAFSAEVETPTELANKAEYEARINEAIKKLTALRVATRAWQVATAAYLRQSGMAASTIQDRIKKFREQAAALEAQLVS